MKFNWGHGLTVAILLAITGITSLVYVTTAERIDMVTDEYYPKELKYQEQIEKIRNYNALEEKIQFTVQDTIIIRFPKLCDKPHDITGSVHLYRPSDKRLDKEQVLLLDSTFRFYWDKDKLEPGKYEVIIEWNANKTSFITKLPLYIN